MENRTVIINGVSYTCLTDEEYEDMKKEKRVKILKPLVLMNS